MREGNFEVGRAFYREAMERASQLGLRKYRGLAAIILAREEILARTQEGLSALTLARKESENLEELDTKAILKKIEKLYAKGAGGKPAQIG